MDKNDGVLDAMKTEPGPSLNFYMGWGGYMGIPNWKGYTRCPVNDPHFLKRNAAIVKEYESGETSMQQVGDKYGLTRERVRQIVTKAWKKHYGSTQLPSGIST